MDFTIVQRGPNSTTATLAKASATVIEAGDLVALDAGGLAIKATAASTQVLYTETGAANGDTEILVITDTDLILRGTADANFAASNRATEVDIVVTWNNQLIDLGASVTDVLKVVPDSKAGTVGSANNVLVRINKTLS